MTDKRDNDPDRMGDKWLNGWEAQSIEDWERENSVEDIIHKENEQKTAQKLWLSFQNSASAIAHMYKEGSHPNCVSLWLPFQNSASSVTLMYKDSQDAVRHSYDYGSQNGHRRRTKELLAWVKKRRCNIRREELIAFLCGKSTPVRHQRHHLHHRGNGSPIAMAPAGRLMLDSRGNPRVPLTIGEQDENLARCDAHHDQAPDLQPFRDALALQGLSGAMSNISMERHNSSGNPESTDSSEASSQRANASGQDDFHGFILDEMTRRCGVSSRKRSTTVDGRMDSPSRKRMRLWHDTDDEEGHC